MYEFQWSDCFSLVIFEVAYCRFFFCELLVFLLFEEMEQIGSVSQKGNFFMDVRHLFYFFLKYSGLVGR